MDPLTNLNISRQAEWLETDGLGGYAMGTVGLACARRYHALFCHATRPPLGRMVLVNGLEAWVSTPDGDYAISSHAYHPGVVQPDGASRIAGFNSEPWPTWNFRLEDGTLIEQQIFMVHGSPLTVMSWRLQAAREGVSLIIRPLISGRDYHGLHVENQAFHFTVERSQHKVVWRPYAGVPAIIAFSNGEYMHEPNWYRNFFYATERERGLEDTEDLAAPGIFRFNLSVTRAVLLLCPEGHDYSVAAAGDDPFGMWQNLRFSEEARRRIFPTALHRAADQYIVERGEGKTIIAGYPWFTDWGRDTFIALRGLCLSTGRIETAKSILLQWATAIKDGLLPNAFPDGASEPTYQSVDAPLWFVITAHEFIQTAGAGEEHSAGVLRDACRQILEAFRDGTRFGIQMDEDGLIAAGEQGTALTWMDAKINDLAVTPRIGKPVEIQALWINALEMAAAWEMEFGNIAKRARTSFNEKFWIPHRQCLYDVIDVDGQCGRVDAALRPNQILAVGGLPLNILPIERARALVDLVERELLTPIGLRTLEPNDPAYHGHYLGDQHQRDTGYHQGTVWPWLVGPFIEAWLRVREDTNEARAEARMRFFEPLLGKLRAAGIGHLTEIADAEPPHTPRGCPFQAWSLGELLRIAAMLGS